MVQEAVNKVLSGMEEVWLEEQRQFKLHQPKCHFTGMSFEMGEEESWWECRHCGHTKEIDFSRGAK